MNEANTVTISVDEYFELRQKAEMNMTVIREISAFEVRLQQFSDEITQINDKLHEIERRNNLNGKNNA